MKQKVAPAAAQLYMFDEIIVDNFAGGGGASTGIELASGRTVAIAINHDPDAILMHKTNHPYTEHLQASVWDVDPEEVCRGRKVGLAWFSPTCTHFSKAKGSPLVDRGIRGLAWVVLRWAMVVRPRVMMLENVEEFVTWGPLMEIVVNDRIGYVPDPDRKGETFDAFVGMLTTGVPADHPALEEACEFLDIPLGSPDAQRLIDGLGYNLEHRDLVAADYGAPTIRKRFAMVARCDGRPVVWPERTHAPRNSEEVKSGKLLPWRSAAEIIDWNLPGYSVFESKAEIKEKYGVTAVRPLAPKTMRRVIRGVDKFTLRSGDPFILECNHSGDGHLWNGDEPVNTITNRYTGGICQPVMAPFTFSNTGGSVGSGAADPVNTIRTAGGQVLASANLMSIGQLSGGDRIRDAREPAPTTVTKQEACVVAANLIQYHDEKNEGVRANGVNAPMPTIDTSNRYGLTCASLVEYYGNGNPIDAKEPMHTVTTRDREALTAVHLTEFRNTSIGGDMKNPVCTITSQDHEGVVAAHVVKFKGTNLGSHPADPVQTVTASMGTDRACGGGTFALCQVYLAKIRPEDNMNLRHWPKIRDLLNEHCGYELKEDELLLLHIGGIFYFIADITLRMLTPRELYNAMGFPPDYVIDRDYKGNEYTKSKQVARCGNAVCPPMATALVHANLPEWCDKDITTMEQLEDAVAV